MTAVTQRQAEFVLTAVKERFKSWIDAGTEPPTLIMDFDFVGTGPTPTIVWEGGPYAWATLDPAGDIDEEFGFTIAPLGKVNGVWTEPTTSWALAIYLE